MSCQTLLENLTLNSSLAVVHSILVDIKSFFLYHLFTYFNTYLKVFSITYINHDAIYLWLQITAKEKLE